MSSGVASSRPGTWRMTIARPNDGKGKHCGSGQPDILSRSRHARSLAPRVPLRERPRLLTDLPPELAALIEDVTIDSKGRAIPKLYSKLQASRDLRAMLDMGRASDRSDLSRLSDAELVAQLSAQAKELGIEIDLNYRFLQRPADANGDTQGDTSGLGDARKLAAHKRRKQWIASS
jgi:hypothetical protein